MPLPNICAKSHSSDSYKLLRNHNYWVTLKKQPQLMYGCGSAAHHLASLYYMKTALFTDICNVFLWFLSL